MVAYCVVVVIDIALLPVFCIVGVATWEMANSATVEDSLVAWVAMAFTVVGLVTENGLL